MDVVTYSEARAHLKDLMDRAVEDREEIVVTRRKGESVVMMSLDAWNSVQETLYLLSTPNNAKRLRDAVAQLDSGGGSERDLIE